MITLLPGFKNGKLFAAGLLVLITVAAFPQRNQIDSIRNLITSGPDSIQVRALNELSWIYKNISVDSATLYARKALALAKLTGKRKLVAEALNSLGSAKQASGEYDSALSYLNQSIQTRVYQGDSSGISNVLNNIGIIYDEKGDYDKALKAYFRGLRIARRNGEETVQAYLLSNIGVVYKKQKQYPKVLEYYNSALEVYKKLNSAFGICVTSGNIGSVLLQTGAYEKSIDYSRMAKKGYEEMGYVRYVPYTLGNMAIAYDSLHQPSIAEAFYKEAYREHLKFNNRYEAAYNSKNLVFFYLKHGQAGLAKVYADKAIALAKEIGAKEMLRDSYQAMARICRELGLLNDAYSYQLKYMALKDSLFEESKTKTILELQVRYETESKELKLAEQRVLLATNALTLEQRNNQVLALASASLLLLVSGVMVYLYQREKRKKQQQEAQFQMKLAEAKLENELQQDRLRISRDLHDNIGSRLLFLYTAAENLAAKSAAEEIEKTRSISAFARDTLHELRRTVWFINKDVVSLDELQLKLNDYFSFLTEAAPLKIILNIDTDSSLLIRSPSAAAIFRIAQEAVSNAIKYAEALHIDIRLSTASDKILLLVVADDGKGFDMAMVKEGGREGNGLKNMKVHAESVRGTISIESRKGKGTTILLSMPME